MAGAPVPEHERTKRLLEEILGPLPPAGSVEFGRYLLELAAHDPRVVPIISQAVLKGELPPEDQLALLRQVGEKIRGVGALAQGGEGSRLGVPQGERTQGLEERFRGAEGGSSMPSGIPPASKPPARGETSAEPRSFPSEEASRAPSPQQAKGEEGGEGGRKGGEKGREEQRRSGYKAYEKQIRGKQRAERGLQRLLKQFEPNLRTFVLHPRKVLLWVLVPVFILGSYWVFEQPIKAQMAKLRQPVEGQAGPPPPPPRGEPPSQDNDLPPPPPPQEAERGSPQEGLTPPSSASPSSEVEPATASAPQGETGAQNGAPQGQGAQAEGGVGQPPVPPPPPALPVYGEVPPPPPNGGQRATGAEGGQESNSPVVKAFENNATPVVKALASVGGEGGQGGQAGSFLRGGQGEAPKVVSLVGGGGSQDQSALAGGQVVQAGGSYIVRKDADPEAIGVLVRRFADSPSQKRVPEEPQGAVEGGTLSEAPSSPVPTPPQRANAGGQGLPSSASAPSPSNSQPPAYGQQGGALPLPESLRGAAGGSASASASFAPPASPSPPSSQVQEGQGGGRQGAQRGDGGVPSAPPALGLRYGQILWGEVVAGVAMAEGMTEAPLLIRLKNEGEEYLAFGGATLNVRTNRISARIDRIYYRDVAYLVSGYVVDETGTLGIKADVREEAPNVAVNLLRGVFGGIKQYVDYYAKATTTTVIPGTGVVTSSAPPPLGLTILGTALGQFAAPPDQISVVRVWVVNPGKKAGLVIVPPQP
jgi:hypothetical protein